MDNYSAKVKVKYDLLSDVLGVFDENFRILESRFNVEMTLSDNVITVSGEKKNVDNAFSVLKKIISTLEEGEKMDKSQILYAVDLVKEGRSQDVEKMSGSVIAVTATGKTVKCKTIGQKKYIEAINKNTVVFGVGPAGTGKTYLAVAAAFKAYKNKLIEKIILTRPAVEAGEKLGFLPGDLQEKIDPYLRPLYDALEEFFGQDKYSVLIEKGIIEIAPLAYMRGRTLSNAFIILDEAQNSTVEQMKMFLTRLGDGSKMVVTGDVTQIDLPFGKESGLKNAVKVLKGVEDIEIINFDDSDVVRNPLVSKIVNAYGKYYDGQKTKE